MEDVTHREIYDRLVQVERKVDAVEKSTREVVNAFTAAQGAFTVLEWVAKVAKPLLWIGGLVAAAGVAWSNFRSHG